MFFVLINLIFSRPPIKNLLPKLKNSNSKKDFGSEFSYPGEKMSPFGSIPFPIQDPEENDESEDEEKLKNYNDCLNYCEYPSFFYTKKQCQKSCKQEYLKTEW